MQSISRRRFLVVGGTGVAGVALAACGESVEKRDPGNDTALLTAALSAELAVSAAAEAAAKEPTEAEAERDLIVAIQAASKRRAEKLRSLDDQAAADAEQPAGAGGSLADLAGLLNEAIAAYRPAAGELSTTDLRSTAIEFLAQTAAELAGARGLLGEDPAPVAFTTGEAAKPFEDTEGDDGTGSSTTTTESPSSTTTAAAG